MHKSINEYRESVPYFLHGNTYHVSFSKHITDTNLELLAFKVDLPQHDFNPIDVDIAGQVIGIPYKYMPAELIINFFNTGNEYILLKNYCEMIFDTTNRTYKYFEDVKIDITVTELDHTGHAIVEHKFQDAILRNLSTVSLAYGESTSPEQFSASFTFVKQITTKSGTTTVSL